MSARPRAAARRWVAGTTFRRGRSTVLRWASAAATAWLLAVCSLVIWTLAPVLIGWRPVVVLTGSMLPVIRPGDVVVIDPAARSRVRVGDVVLVTNPETPSGRLTHRVVAIRKDRTLVTQGDANRTVDSRLVPLRDVEGVARIVVPGAGRLMMLRHHPTPWDLAWAILTVLACALVAAPRGPAPPDPSVAQGHPATDIS